MIWQNSPRLFKHPHNKGTEKEVKAILPKVVPAKTISAQSRVRHPALAHSVPL